MAPRPRKGVARPVEIVLTEEDLAAIIRETSGGGGGRASGGSPWPEGGSGIAGSFPALAEPVPLPSSGGYAPIQESVWRPGIPQPGGVGDTIRRILAATALEGGRAPGKDEDEEE